jgi:tetratricopeptide (TPR) repeat protein
MWWIPDKSSRRRESSTLDLRAELHSALEHGRVDEALELYDLVEARRPDEPRWSHRKGDLLRRIGRKADALRAYERAAYLYSAKGFDACAAATAKLMLAIDPSRGDVLEQVRSVAEGRSKRRNLLEKQLGFLHPD